MENLQLVANECLRMAVTNCRIKKAKLQISLSSFECSFVVNNWHSLASGDYKII
jgi:hypothetical protein